jgi:uncharacterized protein (DUF2237 family)
MNAKNVLGEPLEPCSMQPLTGFHRDGCCNTDASDGGLHLVCAQMTQEFLEFTKVHGNDLSTPMPAYGFPGLKPGDRWCLCADKWLEAKEAGIAPPLILSATHQKALQHISPETLYAYALDAPKA